MTKAPIFFGVGVAAYDQVIALEPGFLAEGLRQRRKCILLGGGRSTLLEDLDEEQIIASRVAEICVFADELSGLVLCDDLNKKPGISTPCYAWLCCEVIIVSLTWYRSRGGAWNFASMTSWTMSATFRTSSGVRRPLIM